MSTKEKNFADPSHPRRKRKALIGGLGRRSRWRKCGKGKKGERAFSHKEKKADRKTSILTKKTPWATSLKRGKRGERISPSSAAEKDKSRVQAFQKRGRQKLSGKKRRSNRLARGDVWKNTILSPAKQTGRVRRAQAPAQRKKKRRASHTDLKS